MEKKEEANGEVIRNNEKITREIKEDGKGKEETSPIPLMALNHVSRLCRNVKDSVEFYTKVLGFVLIERPEVFHVRGCSTMELVFTWCSPRVRKGCLIRIIWIRPMDNHISCQCENMEEMEQRLKELNIKNMKRTVEDDENGTTIDQRFFNDPDGFMIEICNCENLKLVPAGSLGKINLPIDRHNPPVEIHNIGGDHAK